MSTGVAVNVKIPTQLRAATDGESVAQVSGSTVGEVLDSLYERYGELRSRIAEDGGLRRFVNVYVGGEDIRFLDGSTRPWRTATRSRSCPPSPAADRERSVGQQREGAGARPSADGDRGYSCRECS